jgi:hypothetical protein
MPGPPPAHPIALSSEQANELAHLVRAHSTPKALARRAQILLLCHEHPDWTNQQVARMAKTSDRLVRKWRRRFAATQSLADAPRPGAPRRFSP